MSDRVIWKYALPPLGKRERIVLTDGARIVHVALKDDAPWMWVELDPKAPPDPRWFGFLPTGRNYGDGLTHRGTIIDGEFVWHLMEMPAEVTP